MKMEVWDEEEEELDNSQHFQVNVVILEARHLSMINSDCKVIVAIGNRRKTLRSKTARTDAPYFNELCIFNFYEPLSLFLDEILEVKIYGVPKLKRNRLIGGFTVELSTVWLQPNHQFYHKWAALTDAKNPAGGVKGYVKCDIGIFAQGLKWTHMEMDQAENIEDHLLVPFGEVNDRQRAKFIFSIFRADNFSDYVVTQPLGSLHAYVRITYAGKSGKTSIAHNTFEPLWNEELAFDDMIPALCQYVHIELCDAFKTTANGILGTANLDLRKLSHESEKGFLPTYGPSFLYLYQNFGKFDQHNKCPYVNCSFTYMCRLLMALRTEVVDYAEDVLVKKTNLTVKPRSVPPIPEEKYFQYSEFIFFAVVFDILLFDASIVSSKVSVRVNIGPQKPVHDEHILRPTEDVKSALKKQPEEEDTEDTASVRSKKTVTFEGDEVTETASEIPVVQQAGVETPREKQINQPFLRTLMYWPTKWPENKKWGRKLNERLQRRGETNFQKWRQQRKRRLISWPTDWKKKRKESVTSEDTTPPKKVKLEDSSVEMIKLPRNSQSSAVSWEETSSDVSHVFEDNEESTVKYNYSSSSSSNKSAELNRNEEMINLLQEKKSQENENTLQDKEASEPVKVLRKSPNDGYWPLKSLMAWPRDFKGRRKRHSTAGTLIHKWKSRTRDTELKRKFHSELEMSGNADVHESSTNNQRRHSALNKLKAWPTEWRWERKKKLSEGGKVRGDVENSGSDARARARKSSFHPDFNVNYGQHKLKKVKIDEKMIKVPEEMTKTQKKTVKIGIPGVEAPRELKTSGQQIERKMKEQTESSEECKSTNRQKDKERTISTERRATIGTHTDEAETKQPQIKHSKDVSEKVPVVIPPLVVSPRFVPTTEDSTATPTSDNELPEVPDQETSSYLSVPYRGRSVTSDSDQSVWSQKTVWPREVPSVEEEESPLEPETTRKEKKKFRAEKEKISGQSSGMSEEMAVTDYSNFNSRSEEYSRNILQSPNRRRDIYKIQKGGEEDEKQDEEEEVEEEVEEEEEEGEEAEEMKDLNQGGSTDSGEESNNSMEEEERKEQDMKELKEGEDERKWVATEEENRAGKRKEAEESVESEKTKKRHWYRKEVKNKKVFSPDNTTEANVEVYMSLKGKDADNGAFRSDWEEQDDVVNDEEEKSFDELEDTTWEDEAMVKDTEVSHVRMYNGCNSTNPQPITVRQHYGYATFSGRFPCLHINGEWPNALRRMYRSNVIQQSVIHFTTGISDVLNELSSENKIEASEKLKNVFSEVSAECREILKMTAKIEPEDTNLYRERKRYYHREIGEIITKMEKASKKKVLIAQDELSRAYGYLSTLKRYAQDPEDSFPDTEIWLIKDGKSIAQHRMHTQKVVFSPNVSERGSRSGKIQSIIVRGKDGEVVAKLEMFMWFGLGNHFIECRKMLPSGFMHDAHRCPGTAISDVPLLITYAEVHYFQCRVHLFQARITDGTDTTGLADPFVRVTVHDQQKESKVQKETLNPTWSETLVFPKLMIYGPADYVKVNSVTVTVEVIDYDYLSRNELIGRALLKPVVKLSSENYIPPKLAWEGLRRECSETGKILIAVELLEVSEDEPEDTKTDGQIIQIPQEIRPRSVGHRLEVLFWGVRELKKKSTGSTRVYVTLECGGKLLNSSVLKNATKMPNFPGTVQTLRLSLPEEHEYKPPLILKLFQTSSFAMTYETYAGNCIIPSVKAFFCETVDDEERKRKETAFLELLEEVKRTKQEDEIEAEAEERAKKRRLMWKRLKTHMMDVVDTVLASFVKCFRIIKCKLGKSCTMLEVDQTADLEEDESIDWWVKYYASKESRNETTNVEKLVIYQEELEAQPEYNGFSDFIYTFNMVMGKVKHELQSSVLTGKVKAAIKLYRWPLEKGNSYTLYGVDIRKGVLKQLPSNAAIKYVARIYVVSCKNLTPKDIYGKSDPFLFLQVGSQKISDEKNYIPKQVNPIFGKCFEFRGIFPQEHLLKVRVMDHDVLGDNDLIGETAIDLESRYYTKHHASCGISQTYATTGYSAWRDVLKPTEILKTVCKQSNMPQPVYSEKSVRVGDYEFRSEVKNERHKMEVQALAALKKWHEIPLRGFHIVPEHVETRPLYHPSFPGVEQGKIEMWVDIFPADFRYVPPIVDIKPREAVVMELRAIVWNIEDVILDDTTLLFNEKMSDIYVQGWLNALEEDKQMTDVHYRSMNGEGNFNWRFIFRFKYIASERRLVVHKKMTAFDVEPEELKFPCRLELQVWDNDFLSDDFLGSLNLELCSMPRGAKISTRCKLAMFEESTPRINLFKIRRTRGWWPFRRLVDAESSEYSLAGKIDLELEVVSEKEANDFPVGKGREEPRALPEPKRPETSFIWALNPLKTFRYIICRKYGKHLIILLLVVMVVAFLLIGIYAFPGYAVKRMIGA